MGLFRLERTADEVDIDRKRVHLDVSFGREEHIFDVEELNVLVREELVDMLPNMKETGEDVEEVSFFESFVPFEFAMDGHFEGVVVVSSVNLQGELLYAHLRLYI